MREGLGVDADWKRTDLHPAAVDLALIAVNGSPGVGGGDAIAEIIGVGLGLETNDIIGAESSAESADRAGMALATSGPGHGICRKKPIRLVQPIWRKKRAMGMR